MSKPKRLKTAKYGTKLIVTIFLQLFLNETDQNFLCKQNYYTNGFVNISLLLNLLIIQFALIALFLFIPHWFQIR